MNDAMKQSSQDIVLASLARTSYALLICNIITVLLLKDNQ